MSPTAASPWSPFGQRVFAVIWTATLISNIGGWMYAAAAGWLMTSLDSSPLVVSLVQVAATLPIFLFAMPAGALTDSLDKRRFLLWGEGFIAVTSALMAGLVWLDLVTAPRLLVLAFLVSAGDALTAPPWQAVVPLLVPPAELRPAVAANGVGFNISRALGPALGGALVGPFGIAAPFIVNAVSNFGVIGALVWWRAPRHTSSGLPPERLWSAMRTGLRYARFSPPLRDTLIRAAGFFLFASAYWALLPLVARSQLAGGPTLYGILLGGIGASAVAGALGTAAATALFGLAHGAATALLASAIAGVSWIGGLSSLNVSALVALPEWVRGRGSALYVTVMFGALSLGSLIWGQVASSFGFAAALFAAAGGGAIAAWAQRRWKLQAGADLDLSPAMHWAPALTSGDFDPNRGPVLVTVKYHIDPKQREPFLKALKDFGRERRRDGAYRWQVYEDPAKQGRFVETFLSDSWLDHLRHHERVTQADRALQQEVLRFQIGDAPETTHFVAAHSQQ